MSCARGRGWRSTNTGSNLLLAFPKTGLYECDTVQGGIEALVIFGMPQDLRRFHFHFGFLLFVVVTDAERERG